MHQWYYLKTSLTSEDQVGPISEAEFIAAIKSGAVKPKSKVNSPTRTKGNWIAAGSMPAIKNVFEKVKQAKAQKKIEKKDAKRAAASELLPPSAPTPISGQPIQPAQPMPPMAQPAQPMAMPQTAINVQPTTQVVVQQSPQSNGVGMAGFICSLLSIVTCGLLFPIGLLLSLIGLCFKPRGFALAGVFISLGGVLVLAVSWFLFLGALLTGSGMMGEAILQVQQAAETASSMNQVRSFYDENNRLPNQSEFEKLVEGTPEAESTRFEIVSDTVGRVRHRGRDKIFETDDDGGSDEDYSVPLNSDVSDPQ